MPMRANKMAMTPLADAASPELAKLSRYITPPGKAPMTTPIKILFNKDVLSYAGF